MISVIRGKGLCAESETETAALSHQGNLKRKVEGI